MEHFSYLGSVIFNDATVSKNLYDRLSKASSSFGRLSKSMAEPFTPPLHEDPGIQDRRLSHPPVRRRDLGSLPEADQATEQFHQRCLRFILGIRWQDYVSNKKVFKKVSLPTIESILLQVQLRWAGHVSRVEDTRISKAVFFNGLQEGKRDRGAPRKRYKDQLKRQLAQAGFRHQSWQQEASGGDSWRSSVIKASRKFEAEKHEAAKERGQKERAASKVQ